MRYLILIVFLFSMSCSDSNDTPDYLKEEKIIPSEKPNDKTSEEIEFTSKIQIALKERGYDVEVTGEMNGDTRKAMMQFQKDNDIPHQYPQGPLLTIKALEIKH